jgi:predicted metal-binding membrane protein
VQWALERTALLDPSMATTSKVLGGFLFVAAGAYEWTRLKEICLTQCQKPFEFVMSYGGFRPDARGSLTLGLRHGAYCVGCCWLLVALLFVGGLMNLLWVVLLALFISLQKIIPFGDLFARIAAIGLVAQGVWFFSMGMS